MIKVICGALIVRDDSFIAVQEKKKECKGKWSIPGGHLENDESLLEGVIREAKEETGIDVKIEGLIGVYQNFRNGINIIKFAFKAVPLSDKFCYDQNEIMNVKWMNFDKFLSLPNSLIREPQFKKMILDYRNKGFIDLDYINIHH